MKQKTVLLIEPSGISGKAEAESLEGLGFHVIPYERVEAAVDVVRQTRQAFDQFFDLVPDLMCVVSSDGRLCRVNDAWEQILGFSREELVSRPISEFLHPEDLEPTQREIAQRTEGDGRQRFVNRYRTRWGDYRWIEWRSVLGADGYLYAGGRDITEQRHTEDQLRKEADRNAVLLKELRHRVKNSLSAVSGLLAISAADEDGHSQEVLREARGRVETIVQVYESLHRTDPGSEVDLGQYVEDLARVVTTANNPGDTKLELRLTVDSFSAEIGEVFPIGLILNELLTNVLKYAYRDESHGFVDVALSRRESAAGISGILQVTDYGTGFPDGFDMSSAAGTGLMLVRSLVEQLDGTVQLDGSQGNTVRVTFPLN
jgi:PAS domain S-box-containing protein